MTRVEDVEPARVILTGCTSFTPEPVTPATCPTCRGGIKEGDDGYYCARCDSVSPAKAARIRLALRTTRQREDAEARQREAQRAADRLAKGKVLTEVQRRFLASKYGSTGLAWLRAIDQMPA